MNFSIYQRLLRLVLDFLLKAGGLYLVGSVTWLSTNPQIYLWGGLGLSMFHSLSLWLANGFASLFNLTRAAKFGLALAVANVLFVGSLVSLLVWPMKGRPCSVSEVNCDWIDGRITASGVQHIAVMVILLVLMNLIPFLVATAVGRFERRIKRSLQPREDDR